MFFKKMKKSITVDITLSPDQISLLQKIQESDCYEDMLDEEDDDLHYLCEIGVVESILGEQFYITEIGEKFLTDIDTNGL